MAFLRDPEAFKVTYRKEAVAALLARGDQAAHAGGSARALRFYGRVLAIDPENGDVAPRLKRLRRKRLRRRLTAIVAGLAVLVPLSWYGARSVVVLARGHRRRRRAHDHAFARPQPPAAPTPAAATPGAATPAAAAPATSTPGAGTDASPAPSAVRARGRNDPGRRSRPGDPAASGPPSGGGAGSRASPGQAGSRLDGGGRSALGLRPPVRTARAPRRGRGGARAAAGAVRARTRPPRHPDRARLLRAVREADHGRGGVPPARAAHPARAPAGAPARRGGSRDPGVRRRQALRHGGGLAAQPHSPSPVPGGREPLRGAARIVLQRRAPPPARSRSACAPEARSPWRHRSRRSPRERRPPAAGALPCRACRAEAGQGPLRVRRLRRRGRHAPPVPGRRPGS